MANMSFSKVVKCDHEMMVFQEIEKELEKHGTVWQFKRSNNTATYVFKNAEVETVKGKITISVNASKSSCYVEATATTKPVRPLWWWLLMLALLFPTAGFIGGYMVYHVVRKPNDAQISQRTQQLFDSVFNNVANKCEVLV